MEYVSLDMRVIIRWILKKYDGRAWSVLMWMRTGSSGWFFDHGNKPSGSIICEKFLDYLKLLKS